LQQPGTVQQRLFLYSLMVLIDGTDVTDSQTAGANNYVSDAADTGYIGSDGAPGPATFEGEIGWFRLQADELYTADFTPPERCILPYVDTNTVWLGIYEGTPTTPGPGDIHDVAGGNDGDASTVTWGDCCERNYGNYLPCSPKFMTFNGATSIVNLGSDADLDNLPSGGDFTVEAWIRADSFGESNNGTILSKNIIWQVSLVSYGGISAYANYGGTAPFTWTDGSLFAPGDGEWYHVAATWDLSSLTWDIFINGRRATYGGKTAGAGAYAGDAAENLYLGNRGAATRTFDGDIGWVRISDYRRYTANFLPPARCTIPEDDGNSIAIWNYVEQNTVYNFAFTTEDSTVTDIQVGCDCITAGREETCDDETVYVANKQNTAQLTHVLIEDGGVFGSNLLTMALPYPLLPAVPAANDRIYFGIDTDGLDSGPFCSLVFDLLSAQADIADIDWEYWNGAWVALTVQDNTDGDGAMSGAAFDTAGIKSVHWEQPDDWTTTAINGITAYWVRAEVQDVGTAPPIQQNRHPYTVVWPFIEVQSDKVGGDIPALIRQYIRNQSDDDLTSTPVLFSNRTLVGLRTVDRGENFRAYINLAEEQNPSGITVQAGGGTFTFQSDIHTPTGWKLQCLNTGTAATTICLIRWDQTISSEYYGKYHIFLRGYQYNGSDGDIEVQLRGSVGASASKALTDFVAFQTTSDWELLDMGVVTFPFSSPISPTESGIVDMLIRARAANATTDFDLYDLILLPVDEWALDSQDVNLDSTVADALGYRSDDDYNTYLDVDSISWPKNKAKVLLKLYSNDLLDNDWQTIMSGDAIAQSNVTQRYWFLHTDTSDSPEIGSRYAVVNSIQMWRLQRYLSARGAR